MAFLDHSKTWTWIFLVALKSPLLKSISSSSSSPPSSAMYIIYNIMLISMLYHVCSDAAAPPAFPPFSPQTRSVTKTSEVWSSSPSSHIENWSSSPTLTLHLPSNVNPEHKPNCPMLKKIINEVPVIHWYYLVFPACLINITLCTVSHELHCRISVRIFQI